MPKRAVKNALAMLLAFSLLLTGCQGNALPDGMDGDALLSAGREVMLLIVEGKYGTVWERLRSDVAETVSEQDIQELALRQLDGAGVYKQIESSMTTGQSSEGEEYGVAVLYCEFSKKSVLFRLAFDADLFLIGMDIKKQ